VTVLLYIAAAAGQAVRHNVPAAAGDCYCRESCGGTVDRGAAVAAIATAAAACYVSCGVAHASYQPTVLISSCMDSQDRPAAAAAVGAMLPHRLSMPAAEGCGLQGQRPAEVTVPLNLLLYLLLFVT
jgi:hypothetical protein